MKTYHLESEFGFGKHSGKKLAEVAVSNPGYISWCMINLEHFYVTNATVFEIQIMNPEFKLSAEASKFQDQKTAVKLEERENESDHRSSNREWERPNDPTDYTHYNDDLDADQQSPEFWNQF